MAEDETYSLALKVGGKNYEMKVPEKHILPPYKEWLSKQSAHLGRKGCLVNSDLGQGPCSSRDQRTG